MAGPAREELAALEAIFCGPGEWEVLSRSGDSREVWGPAAEGERRAQEAGAAWGAARCRSPAGSGESEADPGHPRPRCPRCFPNSGSTQPAARGVGELWWSGLGVGGGLLECAPCTPSPRTDSPALAPKRSLSRP